MDTVSLSVAVYGYNSKKVFDNCLSFNFIKERYTPYSVFSGSFLINDLSGEIIDVEVKINNVLVHKGVVDTCKKTMSSKGMVMSITSRGYTVSLGHCMLVTEIKYGVTLRSLMKDYYSLPNVTYKDTGNTANYLYIKEHASLWDAIVNLSLKNESFYPYISYTNCICISKPASPKSIVFDNNNKLLSYSENYDYSKIISHIHMRNLEGTYNSYNAENKFAINRNIIRHKHINYDRQWVALDDLGLSYKINFSMRGNKSITVEYKGFNGEDIYDKFSVLTDKVKVSNKDISTIQIYGNGKGIFTRLTAYFDSYNN